MTDYNTLKDIFEMAELLEDFVEIEDGYGTKMLTINGEDQNAKVLPITFTFNDNDELSVVFIENNV